MAQPVLEHAAWEPVAERLASELAERRAPRLDVQRLEPLEGGWALGAVDGGSALVLDGAGLAVGAVRATALAWRAHTAQRELPAPLELAVLDGALARALDAALPGLPPAGAAAQLLERLRALREAERALALAAELGEGDVLALDGALAPREWPAALVVRLQRACAERGVRLVGFCKSSSATLEGLPALLAAARAARGVPEPWWVPLPGGSAAVRFVRGARVFRVEWSRGVDPAEALGKLAPWTRDAAYAGYPYPLALAHNRCALDEALVHDLAHALRGLAARRGVSHETWEEVFGDFHEVLDRGL